MNYTPPFTLTDEMMSLVAEIAEIVGKISATAAHTRNGRK